MPQSLAKGLRQWQRSYPTSAGWAHDGNHLSWHSNAGRWVQDLLLSERALVQNLHQQAYQSCVCTQLMRTTQPESIAWRQPQPMLTWHARRCQARSAGKLTSMDASPEEHAPPPLSSSICAARLGMTQRRSCVHAPCMHENSTPVTITGLHALDAMTQGEEAFHRGDATPGKSNPGPRLQLARRAP